MSRSQQYRLAVRDQGRRRATAASRSAALAGTALAAAFGIVLTQHAPASGKPRPVNVPVAPTTVPARTSTAAPTTSAVAPVVVPPTSTQAPQPPARTPVASQGGGSTGSTGGS